MKKMLLATAVAAVSATAAFAGGHATDVKLGVSVGFTGPLESLAPPMAQGAELAMEEATGAGNFLDSATVTSVRGDSTCIDAAAATATVERLVTADQVDGIVGGMCSGETTASLQNVAMPNGMVMISPSATSPALSTLEDNGLFFRTSPSDARQGVVMSEIIMERGFNTVAVTYTNNDYGKGLADAIDKADTGAVALDRVVEALAVGVVGWVNMGGAKFKQEALLDLLTPHEMNELLGKLLNHNQPTGADLGKSGSRPKSKGGRSARSA